MTRIEQIFTDFLIHNADKICANIQIHFIRIPLFFFFANLAVNQLQ